MHLPDPGLHVADALEKLLANVPEAAFHGCLLEGNTRCPHNAQSWLYLRAAPAVKTSDVEKIRNAFIFFAGGTKSRKQSAK